MRVRTVVLVALSALLLHSTPASALSRVQDLYGQNPISTWEGTKQRDLRIGIGTFWWQILCGSSPSCAGGFSDLTILPVIGLNVAVGPSVSNTVGAVYQFLPEETTPFGGYPSGVGTFLAADPTLVMLQGLASTNTSSIGPLSPPGTTGQSVDYLIECDVLTVDTTSQPVNVVAASGAVSGTSGNRDRNDIVNCQSKTGVPAATGTQVAPTVDAGFVAIGYVAVPFGVSTVNAGMVHMYASLSGYVLLSPPSQQTGTINVSGGITSGAGITATTGTFSGLLADNGETATGDITTYRSGATSTGSLFFGNSGAQYIYYDGFQFNISAPISAPSLVANSLIGPNGDLVLGSSQTNNGVAVNYNTGATRGLAVYNGGTGAGPLSASTAAFSGAVTAASLATTGAISGTTGTFSGAVRGTTGTYSAGLYSTSGTLYLNGGSQYLFYDGTNMNLTSALNVPGVNSTATVSAPTGTFGALNGTTSTLGNGYATSLTIAGGTQAATGQIITPSLTTNTITANSSVTTPTLNATNGAFTNLVATSGTIYLNGGNTQFLQYDGTKYNFGSANVSISQNLTVGGGVSANTLTGNSLVINTGNATIGGGLTSNTLATNGITSTGGTSSNTFTGNAYFINGGAVVQGNTGLTASSVSCTIFALATSSTEKLCLDAVGGLGVSGFMSAQGFRTVSDRRLKAHIAPLHAGLDTIGKLKPVSFVLRSDGRHHLGFIAQDVQKVLPATVHVGNSKQHYLDLSYSELIPVLVKGMQQQQAEIKALTREVAALRKAQQ